MWVSLGVSRMRKRDSAKNQNLRITGLNAECTYPTPTPVWVAEIIESANGARKAARAVAEAHDQSQKHVHP